MGLMLIFKVEDMCDVPHNVPLGVLCLNVEQDMLGLRNG